ncbi:MAG: thymidylate kinase [Patescibacteria group bacterium]|jgi:dTMP kinase
MSKQGKFFVIDGTDGSGKATQTKLLVERLRASGRSVRTISFPRYDTPTGKVVKAYLMNEFGPADKVDARQASKYYADDRKAAAPEIAAWLAAGDIVVADRYVTANMGHQGGKIADPAERMEYLRWNDELEYGQNQLPRPDLNVILHVPAKISQALVEKRGNVKDGHEADLGHLQRAEQTYLEIARTFPGFRLIECVRDGHIMRREDISELVWTTIAPLLDR